MASPFPGMDPYLEDPENWRGFHHLLADEIMAQLNNVLSARYFADVEVRTVLDLDTVGISTTAEIRPDAAVLETAPQAGVATTAVAVPAAPVQREAAIPEEWKLRAVHVRATATKRLVTSIEIVSPYNKRGDGLDEYQLKRRRLIQSEVHLVEIDLLRGGKRPGWEVAEPPLDADYVLLVNRANAGNGRVSEIWPVNVNEPLPTLPIPLLPPDPDVALNLGDVLENVYTRAAYARRIDYSQPVPPPPLRPEMEAWWSEQRAEISEAG